MTSGRLDHGATWPTRSALALSALFGVVCFVYRYLTFRGFTNDHYEYLVRGQQILIGDWPVRDFVQQGLPLMDVVSAAAQVLFGGTLRSEVLLVFGSLGVAAALTCWVLVRLTGSCAIASVMALLQILTFPRSYSYPKLLLYPLAVISIEAYVRAPSVSRIVVLAVVTVVSFLMRHDHGLFVGAGCVAAIVVLHWRAARSPLVRVLVTYAVATAAMLAPYLIYVQWATGLPNYVRGAIGYSTAEARMQGLFLPTFAFDPSNVLTIEERTVTIYIRWTPGLNDADRDALERRFRIAPVTFEGKRTWRYRIGDVSRGAIERIVKNPFVEDTGGIDRASYGVDPDRLSDACLLCIGPGPGLYLNLNAEAWLYYLAWAAVFGGIVLVFARSQLPAPSTIAALTVMTALANATFSRRQLSIRLPDVWGLLPILLGILAVAAWRSTRWRSARRALCGVVLVLTSMAVLLIGNVREELNAAGVMTGLTAMTQRFRQVSREISVIPGTVPPLDGVGARSVPAYIAACTSPSDRLLLLANDPELFYASKRGFAAGYVAFMLSFQNGLAEQQVGIARWRAQSVPLALVYDRELASMAESFPLIVTELHNRYSLAYQFEAGNARGSLLVFADRSRHPTGTYRPLGAPCYNHVEGN